MAVTLQRSNMPVPQQPSRQRLSVGSFVLAALMIGTIGAAAVAGYVVMSSPEASEAVISATGPRSLSEPPAERDDGTWTDADIERCKAQAAEAREAAEDRKLAAVGAGRAGIGGPEPAMLERATYLLCGATGKPRHLCDGYWKRWFIQATTAHAAEFRQVASEAYWTRFNLAERVRRQGVADESEWQIVSNDLDQTTREVAKLHEDITAALRARIADGIIEPEDFGKFFGIGIPPAVSRMIGDARPVRAACG